LAIEYAYGKCQQNPDLRVFFISAETRDTFVRDYKEIAKILDIGQHDPPYDYEVDEFALVRQKLDSGDISDWLIIVDNADNLDLLMEVNGHRPSDSDFQTDRGVLDYIPHSRVGSVLYITRSRTNALQLTNHGSAIHIKGMDPEEAVSLFKAKLDSDTSDEDIWPAALRELEYLPLAIVQVAAYIRHSSYSVSQTLDIIKREDSDSLSDIFTFDLSNHLRMTRTTRIPAITFKTWISTVQYLEHHNQRAVQLLGRMSLYGHYAIPDQLLRLSHEPENQFQSAIGTLRAFSLITALRGPGTCREQYQVNRLVRLFMRHWLRHLRSPTEEWARDTLLTLNCHFHGDDRTYDGSSADLVRHAGSVISFQSSCILQPNEYGLLVRKAVFYLERQQNWSLAEAYAKSAIKFLRKSIGSKHKATLNVVRLLYDVQYESGTSHVKVMVPKQENLWHEQIQVLGPYHRDTLETVVSLLCTLCKQSQFTEADRFLTQVLESGEPSDLENRYVLRAFGRSFWSIMDERDYRKGQQTFRNAWKVLLADEIFTETDFWKDMTDRAHNLLEQGKFKASTVILIEILNVAEFRTQSLQHPRAAVNMKQLASAFQGLNKQEDALKYLRTVWKLQKQNLGSQHLDTLESLTILADNLHKQLEYEEARDHYLEALELYSRFHRSKNVAILETTVNLGRALFELKQFEQAEQRFLEAVKLIDSNPTLVVRRKEYLFRKLGACCQRQQRAGEAARFFEKAFEIYLEQARPVHNNSVITFTGLATTYLDIEEYGRADRLIEDVLGLVPKLEKSESADAPSAWYLVAELLEKRKRYVEAADLFERAYKGFKQKLGPTHKRTMECMFLAGRMSFAAREYQDAASRYQCYLDLQKLCKRRDHKNTSRALFNIGNCMVEQGLLEDAIKLYTKSYEIALEHLGFDHPRTAKSRTELDNAHRLYDAQKPAKGVLGKKRSTIEGSNARGNSRQPLKNVSNERKSVQFVDEAAGSAKETSRGRRVVRATFDATKLHSDSEMS
jgi:tetratricopeptide (TPR) repeat protein